jgi:hypothetical protein
MSEVIVVTLREVLDAEARSTMEYRMEMDAASLAYNINALEVASRSLTARSRVAKKAANGA